MARRKERSPFDILRRYQSRCPYEYRPSFKGIRAPWGVMCRAMEDSDINTWSGDPLTDKEATKLEYELRRYKVLR